MNGRAVSDVSVAGRETVGSVASGGCEGRGFWSRQGSKSEELCGIERAGGRTGGRPVLIRSWVRCCSYSGGVRQRVEAARGISGAGVSLVAAVRAVYCGSVTELGGVI